MPFFFTYAFYYTTKCRYLDDIIVSKVSWLRYNMNKNSQIDVIIEHIKTEYGAEPCEF